MTIFTIGQERANFALEAIEEVERYSQLPNGLKTKDYSSLVRGLPAMLQNNGLGATMAFLYANAENKPVQESHHACLNNQISTWLHKKIRLPIQPQTTELPEKFLNWLVRKDSSVYRQASAEAVELAIWLRRFAEGKNWG